MSAEINKTTIKVCPCQVEPGLVASLKANGHISVLLGDGGRATCDGSGTCKKWTGQDPCGASQYDYYDCPVRKKDSIKVEVEYNLEAVRAQFRLRSRQASLDDALDHWEREKSYDAVIGCYMSMQPSDLDEEAALWMGWLLDGDNYCSVTGEIQCSRAQWHPSCDFNQTKRVYGAGEAHAGSNKRFLNDNYTVLESITGEPLHVSENPDKHLRAILATMRLHRLRVRIAE